MSPKIVRGCGCTICGTTSINANLFGRSPSYNYDRTSRTDVRRPKKDVLQDSYTDKLFSRMYSYESPTLQAYRSGITVDPTPELTTYGGIKLGWIQGVLIPCLLNIWGVMLFLRIAWIVAQAGIGLTILIIGISSVVCVLTTLSLSAICTNGQIQGGGVYYLVSRSLGAELGASVGIIFAFANAVAASMNTIGFCESLNELLRHNGLKIIDNDINDIRIVGAIALLVMCFICAVGMDWETKTQNFLIVIIVLAIINYLIGAAMGPTSDEARAKGFAGISWEVAKQNWKPDFRISDGKMYNFFSVFAMYFPAVTGVQAGANICGDLKDPATAIPKGTLLALAISVTSYLTMATLSGMGSLRDASGNIADLLTPGALESCKPDCEYGLANNYEIMQMMALWRPLIYGGCWAATLSTALTNLLSVPRLIQALGIDRIYPGLIYFSKPFGKHGEPYRGYVLTFFVSLLFLLIADLNRIAPLITNFYLASYALINFCTFHAAFIKPISWRPRFRFYNCWLSLVGCLMCVAIMIIMSWIMTLVTTFIFIILYLLVLYRKPDANWGSSTDTQRYQETIASILHISQRVENARLYQPQILVMTGDPRERPTLLEVAHTITRVGSFMVVANIQPKVLPSKERKKLVLDGESWLRNYRAFYVLLSGFDQEAGLKALLQAIGLGRLSPNIVLFGYKYDWTTCTHERLLVYYRMLQQAFENDLAVAILRVQSNMRPPKARQTTTTNVEEKTLTLKDSDTTLKAMQAKKFAVMHIDSDSAVHQEPLETLDDSGDETQGLMSKHDSKDHRGTGKSGTTLSAVSVDHLYPYRGLDLQKSSTLDAWWLYDDGGMNILLPYIIACRGKEKLTFRIFALAKEHRNVNEAEKEMKEMLKSYRIDYSQLTLVSSIGNNASQATWDMFNGLIQNHKTEHSSDLLISNAELKAQHAKTSRILRLREMLIQHSSRAQFVVTTLPYPRKGAVSAALHSAWLEVLSKDMPPTLFLRGNQAKVIDA